MWQEPLTIPTARPCVPSLTYPRVCRWPLPKSALIVLHSYTGFPCWEPFVTNSVSHQRHPEVMENKLPNISETYSKIMWPSAKKHHPRWEGKKVGCVFTREKAMALDLWTEGKRAPQQGEVKKHLLLRKYNTWAQSSPCNHVLPALGHRNTGQKGLLKVISHTRWNLITSALSSQVLKTSKDRETSKYFHVMATDFNRI